MGGMPAIESEALVALSRAIDNAMDRGDIDEAIRLSSLQWAELNHWLKDHGYPTLGNDNVDELACFRLQLRPDDSLDSFIALTAGITGVAWFEATRPAQTGSPRTPSHRDPLDLAATA
jgi:hypothetical protein